MIKVADSLGIRLIVSQCESFLLKNLNPENAVDICILGLDYFLINLKTYALNHFPWTVSSKNQRILRPRLKYGWFHLKLY